MRDFSEVLRELRIEKKISQKALGEVLGISDRNIRFYETGEHRPDFEGLLILADYFQVSLDYLVGRSDDPERHYNGAEYTPASRMLARKIGTLSESEQKAVLVFIDAMDGLKKAFSQDGKDEIHI